MHTFISISGRLSFPNSESVIPAWCWKHEHILVLFDRVMCSMLPFHTSPMIINTNALSASLNCQFDLPFVKVKIICSHLLLPLSLCSPSCWDLHCYLVKNWWWTPCGFTWSPMAGRRPQDWWEALLFSLLRVPSSSPPTGSSSGVHQSTHWVRVPKFWKSTASLIIG